MGSMLLECLESDADASVVIVFANGSTNNKTTPETLANSHRGLGMRPQQSTHVVMLNDCVSAHWSSMYQCLALTSL